MDVPKDPVVESFEDNRTENLLQFLININLTNDNKVENIINNNNIIVDDRLINKNPKLEWRAVISEKLNPEAISLCRNCGTTVLIHPNYTNAGISGCVGHGKCNKSEDIIKKMVEFRGWILISIEVIKGRNAVIHFKCDKEHENKLTYEALRKGSNCKNCNTEKRKLNAKLKIGKAKRPICDCKGSQGRGKPIVCFHWNHKVIYPDSAKEWDYKKNFPVRPEDIAPGCTKKYWWIRANCGESYLQIVEHRTGLNNNSRCRICSGQEVSIERSLATTHPHIAVRWSKRNGNLKSTDVSHGSAKTVWWTCDNEKHKDEPDGLFHYPAMISTQTSHGSDCPSCNLKGYDQMIGGHEHFVKIANEKHGDGRYGYPERYKKSDIKINIHCPKIGKDGSIHGLFPQTPEKHKIGQGCPKCVDEQTQSKKASEVKQILIKLGYIEHVTMINEWSDNGKIRNISILYIDEYLTPEIFAIEVDGAQHFRIASYDDGLEDLIKRMHRDMIKDKYCLENKINLLRIPYNMSNTKEWIEEAIKLCKQGYHIYFSYRHYYEEMLRVANVDWSKIFVFIIDCPKVKF
jgi:hypothetical protein